MNAYINYYVNFGWCQDILCDLLRKTLFFSFHLLRKDKIVIYYEVKKLVTYRTNVKYNPMYLNTKTHNGEITLNEFY